MNHFDEEVWHKQIVETHLSLLSPNKIFRSRFRKAKQCLDRMATDAKDRLNFDNITSLTLNSIHAYFL